MELGNFTSNCEAGSEFIAGMMNIEKNWMSARGLFTEFIYNNGFSAWHIHDGWVMHEYECGNILHHEAIRIVWIEGHTGYSHTWRCPEIGEKMVIIKNSPHGDEIKPFDMYCYDVVGRKNIFSNEVELKLIEIKQAVFDKDTNNYTMYVKKPWFKFNIFK